MITLKDVYKIYYMGDNEVRAADGINMHISKGEFVAIVGQSGSGKSTCMNIIGCLDTPTEGKYLLNGIDVSTMNDNELADIRNKMLGFIFQQYNLIPKLTVQENVELPLLYAGVSPDERRERARYQLKRVGLEGKEKNYPAQLSGGQQQRVSIARALAGDPSVILADEPTGALDSRTGKEVMEFLKKLNEEGNTIVLITHDNSIAVSAKRIIRLHDGKIVYDGPSDDPRAVVNSSVSFEDDPLLVKKKAEEKRRDEEYKKAMEKGMSQAEFEAYYEKFAKEHPIEDVIGMSKDASKTEKTLPVGEKMISAVTVSEKPIFLSGKAPKISDTEDILFVCGNDRISEDEANRFDIPVKKEKPEGEDTDAASEGERQTDDILSAIGAEDTSERENTDETVDDTSECTTEKTEHGTEISTVRIKATPVRIRKDIDLRKALSSKPEEGQNEEDVTDEIVFDTDSGLFDHDGNKIPQDWEEDWEKKSGGNEE